MPSTAVDVDAVYDDYVQGKVNWRILEFTARQRDRFIIRLSKLSTEKLAWCENAVKFDAQDQVVAASEETQADLRAKLQRLGFG